jgi:murein L,D-transpeptidase YcbB/YkuD
MRFPNKLMSCLAWLACLAAVLPAACAAAQDGAPVSPAERVLLERFYAPRSHMPAWGGSASVLASEALALLAGAAEQGLSPADYRVEAPAADAARFDAALTLAMLRYLTELHSGRANPGLFAASPRQPGSFDPVERLRAALAAGRLREAARAAEPQMQLYQRLKAGLSRYRALALRAPNVLPSGAGRRVVEPASAYAGAGALRELLLALGDMEVPDGGADGDYSAGLAAGVVRFQQRHGLPADGRLGPQTLAALNVPFAQRVRQIELTLERLRWLPVLPDGPLIAINVPSFRLWAYRAPGASAQPALAMRVIVGGAGVHQTPLFIGQMRTLEFNPYWNVPPSIVHAELLPALTRDGSYLARHDMELVDAKGKVAAPGPSALAGLRSGALRVRQRPGPQNALGAVKFSMPNPMNIYLHSTPAPRLFNAARRDFSHGCIRVEDAAALAAFVLEGQPGWTPAAIAAAMAPGATRTVALPAAVPVILFYATALAGHDGSMLFSNDVYRLDQALALALAARIRGQSGPI